MKTKLALGCLLSLAALLTVNLHSQNPPPTPNCVIGASMSTSNAAVAIANTTGMWNSNNTWYGMALVGDWSNRGDPPGCTGPAITLTVDTNSVFYCSPFARQIGSIGWFCTWACNEDGSWIYAPIIFPANCAQMTFHMTLTTNAQCSLSITCVSTIGCAPPVDPPPSRWP